MLSEARKRTKNKYRSDKKAINIEFKQEELPLYLFAKQQTPSMQAFIKSLIRNAMEQASLEIPADYHATYRLEGWTRYRERNWRLFADTIPELTRQLVATLPKDSAPASLSCQTLEELIAFMNTCQGISLRISRCDTGHYEPLFSHIVEEPDLKGE